MTPRLVLAAVLAALALAAPASASSAHCAVPVVYGFTWISLHESGIGCDSARSLGVSYMRTNRLHGWTCTHDLVPPRRTRFQCFKTADHHQTLAGSWYVH